MDTLVNVLPVALLIGGGALVYSQCAGRKKTSSSTSANSPSYPSNKGGKSSTRANAKSAQSSDDEVDLDDFMTAKQRKDAKNQENNIKKQQKIIEQARQERERIEKEEKAKKAAQKAMFDALSPKERKKLQQNGAQEKKSDADKKKDKDSKKAQQKAEQKKREQEMAKKLGVNLASGKSEKTPPKKIEEESEDDGFTKATTKKQRQKAAAKLQKQMDREEAAEMAQYADYIPLSQQQQSNDSDDDSDSKPKQEEKKVEKITTMVPIAFEDRFKVIGKGAEIIELIKQKTDCYISVPQEDKRDFAQLYNNAPVYIKVNGPKEGAALARKIILELAQQGHSPTLNGLSGLQEGKFKCEIKQRSLILGPGGSFLKSLQSALDVKIIMPDRTSLDTEITITGSKAAIVRCKKAMTQLLKEGYCSYTHPNWVKSKVPIDSSLHRRLIGRQGQVIRKIQQDTNTKIVFPFHEETTAGQLRENHDFVYVTGTPEDVAKCTVVIADLVVEFQTDEEQKQYKKDRDEDYDEEIDEELMQYMYNGEQESHE